MPMYEYKCHKCGHVFELIQRFSDPELKVHENCGGELEKLVSAPAFHLKGSGWYATDYAKGSGTNPAVPKAAGDGATKSDEKSDSKSDSKKSDSKTESTPAPAATTTTPASTTKDTSTK